MKKVQTYILRAIKYLITVSILFVLVFAIMNLTGYSNITPDMFSAFAESEQARMMLTLLLALVALHPIIGYVKRPFKVNFHENREQIVAIFAANGYQIVSESEQKVVFRVQSKVRRAIMMSEDAITLELGSFPHIIEGNRKMVVKICYRLSA